MPTIPRIPASTLESLARSLGDHISGGVITIVLPATGLDDPLGANATKWKRLLASFESSQARDRCANNVLAFVLEALAPARFVGRAREHDDARAASNAVLAFVGFEVTERGELRNVVVARTASEAEARAGRLRAELLRRRVHADVLRHCRAELLEENFFHAVLEATKSVAEKLRRRSGLTSDGSELVDAALGLGSVGVPFLAFNTLTSDSERSEQKGIAALMRGMFGTFRNPTAHAPRIHWNVTEDDALDLLTLASFLHRRLDSAARTGRS